MRRILITGVVVFVVVLGLLTLLVATSAPSGNVVTDEDGGHTLGLAMLTMPISDPEPLLESPHQFLGIPHPDPAFDTSALGDNLTFTQDTGELKPLDPAEVLRAVYLGHDANGSPYYMWQNGSPDFRRLLGQIIADFGAVGRLHTSYGSLVTGDGIFSRSLERELPLRGLPTGSISTSSSPSESTTTLTAEWHGLPSEVSAVVLYQGEEAVAWQVPVSGTAAFQFVYDGASEHGAVGRGTALVALATDGAEWNRAELFPG
jgi:hypothetical protein